MILITTAGKVGSEAARLLAEREEPVRILVRDPEKATALAQAGVEVATFGKGADACAEFLSKGRAIAVTGRLVYQEWEAKDGGKRSKRQVIGRVSFGGRPHDDNGEEQ
jgi:uncharacterized protein YbjT (DUF2867 family)